ncbi:MAG: thiol peroxidase [Anaerolineales bacterium]|nr:thiol peroxidase [Anaerolineae bacterium]PWB52268.1 MAG: thiol peroxidase [Anaerolineales bacterium]
MTNERVGIIKFAGNDVTVVGPEILVGQKAPDFTVTNQEWATFHGLKDTQGKVRIIGSLLSLSTSVCDRETRQFNQEAAKLGDDIVIMAISMDLPFTIKNWCAAAGIDKVIALSDHNQADFGQKFGVLLKEPRFLRRAIFVVDRNDQVVYSAYMPVLGEEPKYSEVLEAARRALKS